MNLRRIGFTVAWLIAFLLPIHAQSNPPNPFQNGAAANGLEIRGWVVEPSYEFGATKTVGIAGVQVALTEFKLIDNTVTPTLFAMTSTDSKGEFRFRPERLGEYMIEVKLDGYIPAIGTWVTTGSTASVTLSRDKPIVQTGFALTRRAELSGRVLDESGNPVEGLRLRIYGRVVNATTSEAKTGEDGTFVKSNLQPGPYAVGTVPRSTIPDVVGPFTQDDVTIVDQDFETTYWPGVADLASAISWVAPPGGTLNLPDLRVRKVATYRARVSVKSEACTEEEQWTLEVVRAEPNGYQSNRAPIPVPCGEQFLIRNLHPGSYWFALSSGKTGSVDAWALQQVEIKDGNVAVALTMSKGTNIDGRVVAAEGAKLPPFSSMRMGVSSLICGLPTGVTNVIPDETGRFGLNNVPWQKAVLLSRVGNAPYYVQALRFNGQPIPDGVFNIAPGVVEVVVDDKPASLVVSSVTEGDKPYPQAIVGLVKWPISAYNCSPALSGLWRGSPASPQIQASGLAPGEYRAFAVRLDDQRKIVEPGVLERLASRGEKVVLERGGSKNITLKLSDPSR